MLLQMQKSLQRRLVRTVFIALLVHLVHVTLSLAQQQNEPFDGDVIVYKSIQGMRPEDVGEPHYTFRRAGVSTLARLGDKIFIAFQNFDANRNDTANFDRIATSFSTDNGETWSQRKTVEFKRFPSNLQRPFDPTLVNDGGKLRMYFTSSNKASKRRRTAYYSAVSSDGGETFTYERGVRFSVRGRNVIDSAVGKLKDEWLMIAQVMPRGNANNNRMHGDGQGGQLGPAPGEPGGPQFPGGGGPGGGPGGEQGGPLGPAPGEPGGPQFPGGGGSDGFGPGGQFEQGPLPPCPDPEQTQLGRDHPMPCTPQNGQGGQEPRPPPNNNNNSGQEISNTPVVVRNTKSAESTNPSGRFTSTGSVRVVGAPRDMQNVNLLGSIVSDGDEALFFTGGGNSPLRSSDGKLWRMCDPRQRECVPIVGADPGAVRLGTTDVEFDPSDPNRDPFDPDDPYFEPPDDDYIDCPEDDPDCVPADGPFDPGSGSGFGPREVWLISSTRPKNRPPAGGPQSPGE